MTSNLKFKFLTAIDKEGRWATCIGTNSSDVNTTKQLQQLDTDGQIDIHYKAMSMSEQIASQA